VKRFWIGLIIWGVALALVWWLSKGCWQVVSAIATWFLVLGVVYAFWQVQQARRSTNAQVAVELFKELRHTDVLDDLRKIYELKPTDIKRLLTSTNEKDVELRHSIEGVLDKLELLGALVAQGVINEKLAIEAYGGPPVLKCWYQLGEGYIKEVRKERGLFCKYVEDFAARTFKYQKKKSPKDEWIHFRRGKSGERVNLIEWFKNNPTLQPKHQK